MTPKNYTELQQLHAKYNTAGETGLDIIGFPCNQFANQESKDNPAILKFVEKFGVTFKLMSKVKVNGGSAHPLWKFLKQSLPGKFGKFIKWNFTKFLITREGIPYKRYAPGASPLAMEEDIKTLLATECVDCAQVGSASGGGGAAAQEDLLQEFEVEQVTLLGKLERAAVARDEAATESKAHGIRWIDAAATSAARIAVLRGMHEVSADAAGREVARLRDELAALRAERTELVGGGASTA